MRFLEDARSRSVLRTVGPVYQFRHARLQDRLATPEPATAGDGAAPAGEARRPQAPDSGEERWDFCWRKREATDAPSRKQE